MPCPSLRIVVSLLTQSCVSGGATAAAMGFAQDVALSPLGAPFLFSLSSILGFCCAPHFEKNDCWANDPEYPFILSISVGIKDVGLMLATLDASIATNLPMGWWMVDRAASEGHQSCDCINALALATFSRRHAQLFNASLTLVAVVRCATVWCVLTASTSG
jgi:hypothetical protein